MRGCNNDNAGRSRDDFSAKVYTIEEFTEKAKGYMENSKPYAQGGEFNLKIGSRYASMYDYGTHLLRMLKRACNYDDFIKERYIRGKMIVSVEILKPEHKILSFKEFMDLPSDYFDNGGSHILNFKHIYSPSEKECISLIENQNLIDIDIGRKYAA